MDNFPKLGLFTLLDFKESSRIDREIEMSFIDILDALHAAGSEIHELQVYLDRLLHGTRLGDNA
jgi:hypothetical protein